MGLVFTAGIRRAGRKAMTSATKLFLGRHQRPVSLLQSFGSSLDVCAGFPGPLSPLAELGRMLGVVLNPVGQQNRSFSRSVMAPISYLLWRLRGVALKLGHQHDGVFQKVNPPDAGPYCLRFLKESAQSHTIRRRF
jgi:hypothetical protein